MPYDYEQLVPAEDGYSLVLTIDEAVQHFVEKQLETRWWNTMCKTAAARALKLCR